MRLKRKIYKRVVKPCLSCMTRHGVLGNGDVGEIERIKECSGG